MVKTLAFCPSSIRGAGMSSDALTQRVARGTPRLAFGSILSFAGRWTSIYLSGQANLKDVDGAFLDHFSESAVAWGNGCW